MNLSNLLKKPLFKELLILFVVGFILHLLAIKFFLYWSISEFDSLMHFLGGASVSIGVLWLYFYSGLFKPATRRYSDFFLVSLLGIIFVGVVWEIYELLSGFTFVTWADYPLDTFLDFVFDTLGAVAACVYAYNKEIKCQHLNFTAESVRPQEPISVSPLEGEIS